MKKPLFNLSCCLLLTGILFLQSVTTLQAKIWRIDTNSGSPGDFSTAQSAHDDSRVAVGDTLYFNGSTTNYGNLVMTKRLFLFGPGYLLSQNPETQANLNPAIIPSLRIMPTASGSLVTGMSFNLVFLLADNTLFKRNMIIGSTGQYLLNVGDDGGYVGQYPVSNVIVEGCYVFNTGYSYTVSVAPSCSGIIVHNNLLVARNVGSNFLGRSSVDFAQNIVFGSIITVNTLVSNSILYGGGTASGTGNSYANNIGDGTQFPAANGNQQNQPLANVVVNTGSDDGKFQLKPGSPALAAGLNGEDIGLFGGTSPYVLSGLPAIPAIWYFSAPTTGSNTSGLQVHLKAKSHN